ncbi:MAG: type IV pilus secretin PilQ [Ottowia sp.]|nr:type IV pilus secretin PilQ [Ottowia sp.]
MPLAAWAAPSIDAVSGSLQNRTEVVRIDLSEPLDEVPAGFVVQKPARIALDFPGVTNAVGSQSIVINQGNVRSAQVAEAGDRTRVVLDLKQPTSYRARLEGNSVFIELSPVAVAAAQPVESVFAESRSHDRRALLGVDFRRGVDSAGRVLVDLPSDDVGVDIQRQGNKVLVQFLDTSLPEGLRRRLDVTDFGTPVQMISTREEGSRVRMEIEAAGNWEYNAYQRDRQLVVEVSAERVDPNKLTQGPGFHGEKLSLNFQNIDVRSLLQVIADFTDFNIVTSDSVQGNLTLRLKDVPWDQALDIILEAKDLGMKRQGNVIRIAPKDEMAAKERADLEAKAAIRELETLVTESFQLNYTKASELRDQLTSSSGGGGSGSSRTLLSDRGSVIIDRRTNQVFISDIPSRLEQIRQMIAKLDIPIRQVLIEARIVEASDSFGRSLGVKLGGADLRAVRGGDAGYRVGGSNRLAFGGDYDAITGTTGETGSSASSQFVSFPAGLSSGASPATFAISLFSSAANRFLNLELSALEADGRGRIVSSPRVVTGDQTKAVIKQGQERPYQEATSSGATAVSFKEAVLKLEVTPQITPEGNVILDLIVNKDSFEPTQPGFEPAINKKEVQTNVLVENGGTVVIGGIFELLEDESVTKVPLLGDIPAVGNLFKSRTRESEKRETLVFITPKIVSSSAAVR